ncbi:hemerythrin domain-containing protein [Rhodococcus sp. CX]|nr:hemerythrin domain-containing protein [Rhodococcus sp. CX]
MTTSERDVIEVLTHDHREVERMFAELEALHGIGTDEARQRRKDLTDQVTIELVRHSVAEEADVYPAVKKKVSESEAEHAKEEHAEAERTMKRLEGLKPDAGVRSPARTADAGGPRTRRRGGERDLPAHAERLHPGGTDRPREEGGVDEEAGADAAAPVRPGRTAGRQDPRPGHRPARPYA